MTEPSPRVSTSMLLVLDDQTRAHLARAIENHRRWCRVNAVQIPPLLHQLSVTLAASNGQPRPPDAEPLPAAHAGPMSITYADASQLLSVSERTVRRLVSSGALPAVNIGGCKRITRTAITEYLEELEKDDGTNDAA